MMYGTVDFESLWKVGTIWDRSPGNLIQPFGNATVLLSDFTILK